MIHPCLATMLAVVTTDYPLEPGEAHGFLRAAVDESFNRISVDGECSTNDTVVLLANGARGARARRRGLRRRAARGVRRPRGPDRRRRRGRDRPRSRSRSRGAGDEREARRSPAAIATSPLVKTAAFGHDANWGRVLVAAGSAAYNGGFAQLETGSLTSPSTARTCSPRARRRGPSRTSTGALPDRARPRARRRARPRPRLRPLVRLRAHQRGVHDVSRIVLKSAAPSRPGRRRVLALAATGHEVGVVHGAGPQISAEMERRGLRSRFVGGRRVTSPPRSRSCASRSPPSTPRSARRSGRARSA